MTSRTPLDLRRTQRALLDLSNRISSMGGGGGGSTSATGSTGWTVRDAADYTSALPRFTVSGIARTKEISGITDATPCVVTTTTPHQLITGQVVTIACPSEPLKDGTWTITRLTDTTFSLDGSTLALGGVGTDGTVTHEMMVTVSVGSLARPSHGLRSGTHVTIEDVLGATQANGTFTIDSLTHDIINVTDNGSGLIRITTFLPHGYSNGDQIRIEGVEKGTNDESEGTWEITVVEPAGYPATKPTEFDLDANVVTGLTSAFVTTYEGRGGICSLATRFRLIEDSKCWNGLRNYVVGDIVVVNLVRYTCILDNVNQKPPNATYWSVTTDGAYTSGGKVIRPGRLTINSSTGLTITSTAAQRQAAVAYAAERGWGLGNPIRFTTSSGTVYGVIVGVPGSEGFPYTDPAPLPFYLDNELHYAGPPLLANVTQVAVGRPEMVHYDRMVMNALPYFGSECELPITPLSYENPNKFRTTGGGNSYGTYGKAFFRWDGATAQVVAFAVQQETASIYGDWGDFEGGNVAIVPDCRRPGYFTSGVPVIQNWSATKPYFAGELVNDTTGTPGLYVCTMTHNIDGAGESKDPSASPTYWRYLNASTLTWSGATAYVRDDIVNDGGSLYICKVAHTSKQPTVGTNVPDYWQGTSLSISPAIWANSTAYVVGNIVTRGGVVYRCISNHTSDSTDVTLQPGLDVDSSALAWSDDTVYVSDNVVVDNDTLYICTLGNTDKQPTVGTNVPDYWSAVTQVWELAARERYLDGSVVPGSRVTRNANLGFAAGHPDTNVIGWRFRAIRNSAGSMLHGQTTYVRDVPIHPAKTITSITMAAPAVVTTSTDHEYRDGHRITISGCDVEYYNGDWVITRVSANTFNLNNSVSAWPATMGLCTSKALRMLITEDGELDEETTVSYHLADYPLSPKVNLDVGGQMLSTHDNFTGIRTAIHENLAVWNPPNEINPQSSDIVYNSRMGAAATGVGNQPGLREAREDELTTYSTGTITIDHGVVTLSAEPGESFPDWAIYGELTVEGDSAVFTVVDAADWDTDLDYLIGQLVIDDVAGIDHVFIAIGASTSLDLKPESNSTDWTDLGPVVPTGASSTGGYSLHLQLSNRSYNAPAGTKYVLRPEGEAAKWLTLFMTIVDV